MVSLGLARRLKLKLKYGKQISVSGLGGVPTSITASTEVKITLGPRVVYVVDTLIYENTISAKAQARESQRLDDLQKMEPPAVQTPNYPWPTKMMIRPSPGCQEARVIKLQILR
ncbi:hypothetical protein PHMEG_00038436 [Phytophthora megakarya]|uniref:Uncharacterized protein n=1 Tax=Phytophthora megakarya TaxID=4795 RepID=A0A225UHL8_9STRA|nr:hypothetical protein PHMEG_00038436 [Phytophthora megakarya]